jgi:hypothetical protein
MQVPRLCCREGGDSEGRVTTHAYAAVQNIKSAEGRALMIDVQLRRELREEEAAGGRGGLDAQGANGAGLRQLAWAGDEGRAGRVAVVLVVRALFVPA